MTTSNYVDKLPKTVDNCRSLWISYEKVWKNKNNKPQYMGSFFYY